MKYFYSMQACEWAVSSYINCHGKFSYSFRRAREGGRRCLACKSSCHLNHPRSPEEFTDNLRTVLTRIYVQIARYLGDKMWLN